LQTIAAAGPAANGDGAANVAAIAPIGKVDATGPNADKRDPNTLGARKPNAVGRRADKRIGEAIRRARRLTFGEGTESARAPRARNSERSFARDKRAQAVIGAVTAIAPGDVTNAAAAPIARQDGTAIAPNGAAKRVGTSIETAIATGGARKDAPIVAIITATKSATFAGRIAGRIAVATTHAPIDGPFTDLRCIMAGAIIDTVTDRGSGTAISARSTISSTIIRAMIRSAG